LTEPNSTIFACRPQEGKPKVTPVAVLVLVVLGVGPTEVLTAKK